MAAPKQLAVFAAQAPHPLPSPIRRAFFDAILRPFRSAAECGKDRAVPPQINRIILPLARGNHTAIQPQNLFKLAPVKANLAVLVQPSVRERGDIAGQVAQARSRSALIGVAPGCCAASRSDSSAANCFCSRSISHCRISSFCVAGSKRSLHGVP